jgi:hypothetical protein
MLMRNLARVKSQVLSAEHVLELNPLSINDLLAKVHLELIFVVLDLIHQVHVILTYGLLNPLYLPVESVNLFEFFVPSTHRATISTMQGLLLVELRSLMLQLEQVINQVLLHRVELAVLGDLDAEQALLKVGEGTHLISQMPRKDLKISIGHTISYKRQKQDLTEYHALIDEVRVLSDLCPQILVRIRSIKNVINVHFNSGNFISESCSQVQLIIYLLVIV